MGYVDKVLLLTFVFYVIILFVIYLIYYGKILYIKWIKGECRHFCCVCKYRNQCFDNLEQEVKRMKKLEWIKAYMMVQGMRNEIKWLRQRVTELEQEKYELKEQLKKEHNS